MNVIYTPSDSAKNPYRAKRTYTEAEKATLENFSRARGHFTKAVKWEIGDEEALKQVRRVKLLKENNARLRYLSIEESQELVKACDPHLRPIVIAALNTGMRKGEIPSLKWDNVDMRHGFILLDKTKNGQRREIPINAMVRATLQGLPRRLEFPMS